MERLVTGTNSLGEKRTLVVQAGGFERYVQSKNVTEFAWQCVYVSTSLLKEVRRALYINEIREQLKLSSIELIVFFRSARNAIRIKDFEDVAILENLMLQERLASEALALRSETQQFIKANDITAEDLEFLETTEFAQLLKAYDITVGQTAIEIEKSNVTFIRNWDYRVARDAGFEGQDDLGLTFTKDRTKVIYESTLLDKCKALVSLKFYQKHMPVPERVITDGEFFKVIKVNEEIPEGWKNTPLTAGEPEEEYVREYVLPRSAAPGRNRKISGDPNTAYEDYYIS